MDVRVSYATEVKPHQMLNPYAPLQLTVVGDVDTVANWLDEHMLPFQCVMGGFEYKQGAEKARIVRALQAENTLDLDGGLLKIERLTTA